MYLNILDNSFGIIRYFLCLKANSYEFTSMQQMTSSIRDIIVVTVQYYIYMIGYERDLNIERVITMAFEKKRRKITVSKLKSCLVYITCFTIKLCARLFISYSSIEVRY